MLTLVEHEKSYNYNLEVWSRFLSDITILYTIANELEHENLVFIALLSNIERIRQAGAIALTRQADTFI